MYKYNKKSKPRRGDIVAGLFLFIAGVIIITSIITHEVMNTLVAGIK